MNRFVIRLVAATFVSSVATFAQAETLWVGNAFVTVATQPTCGTAASVSDYSRIIYRPASVPLGNGADSYFAYVGSRADFTMTTPNNTFRSGINYGGHFVSSYINFGNNVGAITAWTLTPSVISASQTNYTLNATFTNFYGVTGCNVSLQANLELLP